MKVKKKQKSFVENLPGHSTVPISPSKHVTVCCVLSAVQVKVSSDPDVIEEVLVVVA